jgi:hypothetical protein
MGSGVLQAAGSWDAWYGGVQCPKRGLRQLTPTCWPGVTVASPGIGVNHCAVLSPLLDSSCLGMPTQAATARRNCPPELLSDQRLHVSDLSAPACYACPHKPSYHVSCAVPGPSRKVWPHPELLLQIAVQVSLSSLLFDASSMQRCARERWLFSGLELAIAELGQVGHCTRDGLQRSYLAQWMCCQECCSRLWHAPCFAAGISRVRFWRLLVSLRVVVRHMLQLVCGIASTYSSGAAGGTAKKFSIARLPARRGRRSGPL